MCFTGLIIQAEANHDSDLIIKSIEEQLPYSPDGFAVRVFGGKDAILRTLDKNRFSEHLRRGEITKAKFIHFHLRRSTNRVCEEFIHLWKIGGYYCSHNGRLSLSLDKNDSLEFFLKHESLLANGKWQELEDSLNMELGDGVFVMSKEDGGEAVIMSVRRPFFIYKCRNQALFLSKRSGVLEQPEALKGIQKLSMKKDVLLHLNFNRRTITEYPRTVPK